MSDELVTAWTDAAHAPLPARLVPRLVELCADARRAYPELADDHALVTALAARAPAGELDGYLARVRPADLALALAAARGAPTAIPALERAFHGTIEVVCRRFETRGQTADDLRQVLRERLFVAPAGSRPKIADYSGQGFLENWLRVTAVRVFLDVHKRKDRAREQPADDRALDALPEPGDLGLEVIKAEYRAVVARAMHEAAAMLEPGDRHLLRQHLVEGLTIDQLGEVLGLHRATAARRIARATEQLASTTRRLVASRLALAGGELDEVLALVRSRLDVSLARLLATPPPRPPG